MGKETLFSLDLKAGYYLNLSNSLSIVPKAGLGLQLMSTLNESATTNSGSIYLLEETNMRWPNPLALKLILATDLEYKINQQWRLYANYTYTTNLVETDETIYDYRSAFNVGFKVFFDTNDD